MSRYSEYVVEEYIAGRMTAWSFGMACSTTSRKQDLAQKFVHILIYSDIRADCIWPRLAFDQDAVYEKFAESMAIRQFSKPLSTALYRNLNWCEADGIDLLEKLCRIDKSCILLLTTVACETSSYPVADKILRQMLERLDRSIWLDASRTKTIRKALYQFTKWPEILEALCIEDKGQILEQELGL